MPLLFKGKQELDQRYQEANYPHKQRNLLREIRKNDLDQVQSDNDEEVDSQPDEAVSNSLLWLKTNKLTKKLTDFCTLALAYLVI